MCNEYEKDGSLWYKRGTRMNDTWLTPKKAAMELKRRNPQTMIGEKFIRGICEKGFPHIPRGNRKYINIDTFDEDLINYSRKRTSDIDYSAIGKSFDYSPISPKITSNTPLEVGKIRRIEV